MWAWAAEYPFPLDKSPLSTGMPLCFANMTGGARYSPRLSWEGKLELTKAPRSHDRGCGNSRRFPPGEARKDRSGRYVSEARRHLSTIFGYSDVMASRSHLRANRAAPRRRRRRRIRLVTLRRFARSRWRACRAFMKAVLSSPPTVRAVVVSVFILVLWLGVNWTYHAYSKPTEILFPLAHSLDKSPAETWNEYGSLFREHATAVITPDLLAALAQVEGGGNPVARTYWRWRLTRNPLELYQPASSAVGMYQTTDGTFREAKHYCIHDHVVIQDG